MTSPACIRGTWLPLDGAPWGSFTGFFGISQQSVGYRASDQVSLLVNPTRVLSLNSLQLTHLLSKSMCEPSNVRGTLLSPGDVKMKKTRHSRGGRHDTREGW